MEKPLRLTGNPVIILLIISFVFMSACKSGETSERGRGHIFVYDLSGNPATLDPQTAVDEYSRQIMGNLYQGLLRTDSGGNVTYGAAMEYEISDDLLTYTFYLRDDIFWTDKNGFKAQCTAKDFVFGFGRLFNPQVKSRNAADYYCILNSKEIHEGNISPDLLGVYAENDFKLTIRLEYPDRDFPVLLTAPPAFPCNEEFYIQSSGRYGLIADAVPSNGAFFLREWVYDPWWTEENRIILRLNSQNSDEVNPSGINYLMDRGNKLSNYTSGESDCIIIRGDAAEADEVDALIKKNYPYTGVENSVWGIMFNPDGCFSEKDLRISIAAAADINEIDFDKIGYRRANGIIPDSVRLGGEFYRDLAGVPETLEEGSHRTVSVNTPPVLIVPVTSEKNGIDGFVREISRQWQEKLSLYCKIETLSVREYAERLTSGNYDIAAVKLTPSYNSPSAVFNALFAAKVNVSEENSELSEVSGILRSVSRCDSDKDAAELFLSAENAVIQAAEFIPVCFVSEYFFSGKKIEGIDYNPFSGAIIFEQALSFN